MPSAEKPDEPDGPSAPQSAPALGARTPQQRERRLFWWVGGLTIVVAAAGAVAGVLVAEPEGPGGWRPMPAGVRPNRLRLGGVSGWAVWWTTEVTAR